MQAWLGHADVKTTQRYIHSVPAAADAALLAQAFAAAEGAVDPRTPAGAPSSAGSAVTERT